MQRNKPIPGQIYKHFKNNLYQVITPAIKEDTREEMVVYQALYGDYEVYIRTLDNFLEPVDKIKYPSATQNMRFELVEKENLKAESKPEDEKKSDRVLNTSAESENKPENEIEHKTEDNIEAKAKAENKIKDNVETKVENNIEIIQKISEALKENQKAVQEDVPEEFADPRLLAFCDAATFEEKYQMVKGLRYEITDRLINDIAVVLDVVIPEGTLDSRYEALIKCLQTFCKYEVNRLR